MYSERSPSTASVGVAVGATVAAVVATCVAVTVAVAVAATVATLVVAVAASLPTSESPPQATSRTDKLDKRTMRFRFILFHSLAPASQTIKQISTPLQIT